MRFLCGVSVHVEIEPDEVRMLQGHSAIAGASQFGEILELRLFVDSSEDAVTDAAAETVVDLFGELGLPLIDVGDLAVQAEMLDE